MHGKKIFFWSIFYILLFIGGYFLDSLITYFSPPTIQTPEVIIYSPAPPDQKLDTVNALYSTYIRGLGFHADTHTGDKSTYQTTRKSIIDAYANGDRSSNLMRAYIYLLTQEGNFSEKELLTKELCKDPKICEDFLAPIKIQGVVKNPQGKNIAGASVEILGTSHKTLTDEKGEYSFSIQHISPAVLRLQASAPNTMMGVRRVDVAEAYSALDKIQSFRMDFILNKAFTEISIDTKKKIIIGEGASKTDIGYMIVTPYTKYLIPFDTITKHRKPYIGKLKALVFEFDRQSSSFLLSSDVFDKVGSLIGQSLITYGMPFIIFTAENGERLDVLSTNPMTVWTTIREKKEIENFLKYLPEYQDMFSQAYEDGKKSTNTYPIDSYWEYQHGNKKMIPLFWVFDRATGFWSNEGFRFVTENYTSPYNIESHFYTIRIAK